MSDKLEATEQAIVEDRARQICVLFDADPEEVLGAYAPVRCWASVAYHINEAITSLRTPTPEQAGEVEQIIGWVDQAIERADKHGNTEGMWLFAKQWKAVRAALQSTPPAQPTADAVDAKAIAAAVVQSVCETDPADPEHPDTVSIEVSDLEAIVRQAVENATEATMAGDYVMVPNLLSAFRTTVSDDGKYELVFRFKSMEAMHAADDEWRWLRNEKMGQNPRPMLETEKLVKNFTDALRVKLAKAETKYGYNDEWLTSDWEAVCKSELARHVAKGDPLDVAAYAAFCWARGWTTAPSPELAESQEEQPA